MKILLTIAIMVLSILSASEQIKPNIQSKQLVWQDSPPNALYKMSFKQALSYCSTLQYNELKNWRIPNTKEIFGIIDTHRIPTIKSTFNYSGVGCYWSYMNGKIGSVDFKEGTIDKRLNHINQECFVRCVHDK